jgi:peptidyl-prolyl cis-trans isomerase D
MITALRNSLDTWYVRAFFVLMIGTFVFWGVGDVVRMFGTSSWVVKVAGQTIEAPAFQAEYQRALSAATANLPPGQEPPPDLRQKVADQAMQRTVTEAAMGSLLRDLRLVSPDSYVAAAVREMQVFKDTSGKFSKQQFDALLRNNGLTEPRFLQSVRIDLTQRQLFGAIAAGAVASRTQALPVYAAVFEKRAADMVEFPFNRAPTVLPADEATLRRFYDNHPDLYSTKELRRVKAVILSPKAVAKEIAVSDEDLRAAYDRARAGYVTPEKRSARVISAADEAQARSLMAAWQAAPAGGDDWAVAQAAATAAGAAPVALDDATRDQFPDTDLAAAVFGAQANTVVGPVKGALAWYVLKVSNIVAGSEKSFDSVKEELKDRVLADKATDIIYPRANTLDNLLGNGTALDDLPGDLGLIAVTGTLDADGKTAEGEPAPLPDPTELRTALIDAAFKARIGDPLRLIEAKTPAGPAYFAIAVEEITAPGLKPFDDVRTAVADEWMFQQQRHAQEEAAAAMLASIHGGRPFADAATIAGVVPKLTPIVSRGESAEGMPVELHQVLFGLKKAEATMVETSTGFIVAVPAEIVVPDPAADTAGFAKLNSELTNAIGSDLVATFQEAVRLRAKPRINQTNFDQIVQPRNQ